VSAAMIVPADRGCRMAAVIRHPSVLAYSSTI
jgi:hypothetical protein